MRAPPGGLTPSVARVRDVLAARARGGTTFDSVLLNLYPDGASGMRWHPPRRTRTGEEWSEDTAVVSVGADRVFEVRDAQDHARRWAFTVRQGDVFSMRVGRLPNQVPAPGEDREGGRFSGGWAADQHGVQAPTTGLLG